MVEMYRAALLAPDVNKSRSGSKGQKRSAKGKKGKVCSYIYVCVCVCAVVVAMRSATCATVSTHKVWVGSVRG